MQAETARWPRGGVYPGGAKRPRGQPLEAFCFVQDNGSSVYKHTRLVVIPRKMINADVEFFNGEIMEGFL